MSKPILQLGGGNWAAKQGNLLAFAEGDTSGKYIPRELGFSRAADIAATRVNKDGLIEKGRENLFRNTVFAGAGLDTEPTGGSKFIDSTGGTFNVTSTPGQLRFITESDERAFIQSHSVTTASLYSFSVFVDEVVTTLAVNKVISDSGEATDIRYEEDGVEISTSTNVQAGKRYTMVVNKTNTNSTRFRIGSGTASRVAGDVTLSKPQLEVGIAATDYIENTSTSGSATAGIKEDEPRIDYTSGSARLLLEPERTNLVTSSEGNISQMGGSATRTYKPDEVSPTGSKGGVVELSNLLGADGDRWQVVVDISDSLPSTAKTWTGSMYIKGTSGEKIDYQIKRNNAGGFEGSDIETVTFDGTWQRLTATFTNDTDNDQAGFFLTKRDSTTADKVLIWGRQIEEGPNATSYIPTHGATDTRVADDVTTFDMTKLDLGTTCSVYWEGEIYGPDVTYVRPITTFKSHSSPSNSDRFLLHTHGHSGTTCTLTSRITLGGTDKDVSKSGLTIGDKVKCLTVIDGTSHKFYVNGDLAGSVTITSDTYFNSLDLSNIATDINYTVDDIRFYPTAIGQAEAEALTDL